MSQKQADLLLVVDASQSMGPCFPRLKEKISDLLHPLRQADFDIRIGVLGYASGRNGGEPVHDLTFLGGAGAPLVRELYSQQLDAGHFFTHDADAAGRVVSGLTAKGNEDTLLALDIALDFPFRPLSDCRRMIAVFTDERLEDGVSGADPCSRVSEIAGKIDSRHVMVFIVAPPSKALERLTVESETNGVTVHPIDKGEDGLRGVDFGKILDSMGKTVTTSLRQMDVEAPWNRAIFGQDRWPDSRFTNAVSRSVVLAVGESSDLDTSKPLKKLNIKLRWTAAVDLDLHAYFITQSGAAGHVYFGNRMSDGMVLDNDAGIGDTPGSNEENITLTKLAEYKKIVFATKIFRKGGSFSDYDGKILIETSNGQDITVPLSATQIADWCLIALLDNTKKGKPKVVNLNRVESAEPDVNAV